MTESRPCGPPDAARKPPELLCAAEVRALMAELDPDWRLCDDGRALCRDHDFPDFHHTMAFVNALAWMAHRGNHHPDLQISYSRCSLRLSTHESGGLTHRDRDFALGIDRLLSGDRT